MNSCLLKKSAGNRANRLRIMSNTLNSFRFICSGIKPLYTSSSPNLSKDPIKRTQQILVATNSQHCWMLLVASVCTPCCCVLMGDDAPSLKLVKLLATCKLAHQLSTLLGQQSWELLRPFASGLRSRIRTTNFRTAYFHHHSTTQKKSERTSPKFGEIRSYNWHLVQFPLCWRDMQGPVKWLPMSVPSGIYWEKLRCKHWWVPVISLQKRYHNSLYMKLNLVNSSVIDNLIDG